MKKLSAFQIILLAVFGALAVAGTLIFALAVNTKDGDSVGLVEVWGTFDQAAMNQVIQDIADTDGRFDALKYIEKEEPTYNEELTNAFASGTGPDLFFLRHDFVMKNATRVIPTPKEKLSSSQFEDLFVEAADVYYTSEGTLATPLLADPLVLYWNRDILESGGYAKPPATWAELPEMVATLTKRDPEGGIKRATIAFGEFTNIPNAKAILTALIFQAGGTVTVYDSEGEVVAGLVGVTEDSKQKAESALRFYTEFANPAKVDYTWTRALPEARKAFAAGDVALYVGFASEGSLIAATNPNLNFAVARLPQLNTEGRGHANTARVYALATPRTAKNPNGAMTIASLFATKKYATMLSNTLGIPSALRDVLNERSETDMQLFNREALIARTWLDPDPSKTDVIFRAMIERVTSGAMRLSEAVQRADEEMDQLLDNL